MFAHPLEPLAGRLLVASPLLTDPNFHRAVVLICTHNAEGTFGIVLNRALAVPVSEPLPAWASKVVDPPSIFRGGPVLTDRALALARLAAATDSDSVEGWDRVTRRVGLLDLQVNPSVLAGIEAVRIFVGHAGWSGGQLEGELMGEAWFVVESAPEDAFDPDPKGLWRRVLRRQKGRLALFADYPPDVLLN